MVLSPQPPVPELGNMAAGQAWAVGDGHPTATAPLAQSCDGVATCEGVGWVRGDAGAA